MSVAGLWKRFSGTESRAREESPEALPRILIVGSPNVGKSALFNRLTGRYVTVSNYPGTTVEVSRGRAKILRISSGFSAGAW